ncbi:sensor histidine kinase [Hymenobacter jeollabukensis]|uniref:histidine kinase n=1 Tax=Hymenobacter jeollabukensis TaxID=2025313 RepID=A0A5R8WTM3_9BACT|nr:ATP-binding protein [Hymenobacter jeollabukensis]TLM95122.1 HAMP domain-containing protein [Hymenobacter jeollabukensis]
MSIKAKITVGLLAMLALLIGLGAYAYQSVQRQELRARSILQANFYSVALGQQMLQALDELPASGSLPQLRWALTREAGNVTEPGEQQLVDRLVQALARYEAAPPAAQPAAVAELRRLTHGMVGLNMRALTRKNAQTNAAATQARYLLLAWLSVGTLVALGLVLSVPEAAVSGLRKLSASISHAAGGDFAASIPVESRDEFGRVAAAFNALLTHLNELRSANLAELLTERNRVLSIVQTLDEALLLLDADRRVIVANPVACTLLGLPEKQLLGQPAAELAGRSPLLAELLRYIQLPPAQRPADAVLPVTLSNQPEAYYRLSAHEAVLYNAATDRMEFVGSILALHNVSDFKRQDQLKTDFLATATHELKTPLSSINFQLKLLQNKRVGPLNEEQQRIVATLRGENDRLRKLATTLLDVSRLEAGAAVPLQLQPVPVAELVAAAAEPVRLQLAPKGLQLDVQLPPALPPVRADLEKTAWVLLNLLSNAIRYSPAGGAIRVRAEVAADGQRVRVLVQDDGPGIAPPEQQRIFERYVQLPAPDGQPARGGTGLGLSISRAFIETQGGELGVESTPGAGSTFYFTLPVAAPPA